MKIVEAISGMIRSYTFVFTPEPEGGYTVTCPALPGLVTYGESLPAAREMARDAMEGLIEALLERGATIPHSDAPETLPRFNELAHTLREESRPEPVFEQLTATISETV
jgi:antitoxin HicB